MAEITERIGGRIRELREALKAEDPRWTQDYVARQLPGTRTGSEVSRWERGEVKPRDETLEQLAELFGVDAASLFAGPAAEREGSPPRRPQRVSDTQGELVEQVRATNSELAEVRGELSEVRTELQRVLSLLQRDERGREDAGN